MTTAAFTLTTDAAARICPKAPGDAQSYADQITGYILWGVLALFVVGIIVGIGAVVAGRVFAMPHSSKAGVVAIVVVFLAAVAYMVLPGMIAAITGSGCV
ncbi:hypothetical protein N864_16790 [Intrasporangium chromatireducens Q5-1]|uniref:Uncharacterized protein n=1 Tax=Intrasporangium chromatireducens Q5-1 TaxID=584657 RepID=W9GPN5_9MICO|nr:hypothetical protein [Intrasporangium chromatireducens]EWT06798.1 hypothetical protein N864_16790 [Intrasporangium chromatireducens Q5-1]